MSIELKMLTFTIILGIFQLLAATQAATAVRGLKWNLSPRDEKQPDLTGVPGRIERSFKNLMETLPFFVAAILMVQIADRADTMTAWGAQLYFFSRLLYVPVYALGVPGLRTGIWCLSMLGIALLLVALI